MGIQINGQTDTISASDGGLAVSGYELTGASNINVTGIVTTSQLNVGTGGTVITTTAGGLVGVGTVSPNNLLEVRGTSDGQNVLHLSNSAGTTDGSAENQVRVTCNGNNNWANLDIQAYQTIFTQNGGEKARIYSGGTVGINTDGDPTAGGFATPQVYVKSTSTSWTGGIHLEASANDSVGVINHSNDGLEISQTYRSGGSYQPIIFRTSGAEALRITNDGRVINTEGNTPAYVSYRTRFYAKDTNALIVCEGTGTGYTEGSFMSYMPNTSRGGGMYLYNANGGGTAIEWFAGLPYSVADNYIIARKSGPTDPGADTAQTANKLFQLANNGNLTINGTLTQSASDDRLKTNRVGITSALEKVKTLEGFTYDWNDDAINNYGFSSDDGTLVGMSAQELQLVLPEAVKTISYDGIVNDPTSGEPGEPREYLTIQYERVVPLLVQALKELSEKNDALEARLATLEGQ